VTGIGPREGDSWETAAGHEIVGGSGTSVTVTSKPQESCRCRASLAVQATGVVPIGNFEPLAGTHVTVTGASPPTDVASSKAIVSSSPVGDSWETETGQVILGGSAVGGGGATGFRSAVQAANVRAPSRATPSREEDLARLTFRGRRE
jgi:hypothetical protein